MCLSGRAARDETRLGDAPPARPAAARARTRTRGDPAGPAPRHPAAQPAAAWSVITCSLPSPELIIAWHFIVYNLTADILSLTFLPFLFLLTMVSMRRNPPAAPPGAGEPPSPLLARPGPGPQPQGGARCPACAQPAGRPWRGSRAGAGLGTLVLERGLSTPAFANPPHLRALHYKKSDEV